MKKIIYLAAITLITLFNSACAQTEMIENITFKSNTRGGQRLIEINKSSISFTNNGSTQSADLNSSDWESIISTLKEIKLSQLESLSAPGEGRTRDAAWHSSIVIITNDGNEYRTATFDNAKAPKELGELMKVLIKYDKDLNEDNKVLNY